MEARIRCVYDEGALENTGYIGAKGTSFLIDIGGKRVLFDTGLRHRYLLHNLEQMDVPPDSIDAVVVSQSHPDNSRALNGFLTERSSPVDVFCPEEAVRFGGAGLFSGGGVSEENRRKADVHTIRGWEEVVPGAWVTPVLRDGRGYGESFLVLDAQSLAVVSGRGSAGPGPAIEQASQRFGCRIQAFIGSVFLEKAKKPLVEMYAGAFAESGIPDILLNHCTGRDGIMNLRTILGLDGVRDFYVGEEYILK